MKSTPKIKRTFIIKRRNWARGNRGKHATRLKNPVTGRMCCLGQIACQIGYQNEDILGISYPQNVRDSSSFRKIGLVNNYGQDSAFANDMMKANDDGSLTEKEREEKLSKIAARKGYKLIFE